MENYNENKYYRPGYIPNDKTETDDYIEYHTCCRAEDIYAEQMLLKHTPIQRLCDRFNLPRDLVIGYLEKLSGTKIKPLEFIDCDYSVNLMEFYSIATHFGKFPD